MIDLSKACIICKSDADLDTKSILKLEGDEYRVSICVGCEDEAAPRLIKTKLVDRMNILRALCQEAAAILGIELTVDTLLRIGHGSVVSSSTPVEVAEDEVEECSVKQNGVRILNKPMKKKTRGKPSDKKRLDDAIDVRTGRPIIRESEKGSVEVFETPAGDVPALAPGEYAQCGACMGPEGLGTGAVGDKVCEVCGGAGMLAP